MADDGRGRSSRECWALLDSIRLTGSPGFALARKLEDGEEVGAASAEVESQAESAESPTAAEIETFISEHPQTTKQHRELLRAREIAIGMSQDEVLLLYGEPAQVNRTGTAGGIDEQWVYPVSDMEAEYLYFTNGKLNAWQD